MGIKWNDIHIGNSLFTNSIFIGKSKPMKDNPKLSEWTDRSGDMSDECMYAVCMKLKQEAKEKNDKPYTGYKYEGGSQLIWIAPGYNFEIVKLQEGDE